VRKSILTIALAASAMPAAPALADHGRWQGERGYDREYSRTDNGIRTWQGDDGRNYCRRPNGTTGILVGGVAGALIGRSIDTRGDRAVGTILGAAGGALLGRAVERSSARCR
jgi:hypothetical protein